MAAIIMRESVGAKYFLTRLLIISIFVQLDYALKLMIILTLFRYSIETQISVIPLKRISYLSLKTLLKNINQVIFHFSLVI